MFKYGADFLTVEKSLALANGKIQGILTEDVKAKIAESAATVERIVAGEATVYGVNTGFGPLCDTKISPEQTAQLQENLLLSHSVGVGNPIIPFLSKLMLICKVHALAQAYSGIRLATVERILWHLENDLIPVVPEKGSVGASGDLAPLAHLFLPLIGQGKVWWNGEIHSAEAVLAHYKKPSLQLGPKEGLALINGTQFILAHAVVGSDRMQRALRNADIIGALSLEALMGSAKPFDERLHQIRPFPGNQFVAKRIRQLLEGSEIMVAHHDCDRVQDPYSLRCIPQVHGASYTAWQHLHSLVEIELNSVTDNPVIFGENDTISGGNFHGQPLAMALDYATLATAELGNIADRRCYLMLEGRYGLPKLLLKDTGLNSGFMIPQYTTAALVSENKSMCFPASADSIPTSLGQEDHVSMGSISSRKLLTVLENLSFIQAIELLYACQAIEYRRPLKSGQLLESVYEQVRAVVPFIKQDTSLNEHIHRLKDLLEKLEIEIA